MPRTGLSAEAVREQAISIAEHKIASLGFERVRLVDIAKEIGVSHVALYKHFPDRAALLDAVSERWLLRLEGDLLKVATGSGTAKERLVKWFETLHQKKLEKVRREPELYRAFDFASQTGKPFVVNHLRVLEEQVSQMVTEAIAEGSLRDEPPVLLAKQLLEMTMTYHHPKLVFDRQADDRMAALHQTLQVILRGMS